jgi:glycosyltransferase involved in cell wall biosynthesis
LRIGIMLRHIGEAGGIVTFSRNLVTSLIRVGTEHHFALLYGTPDHLDTFAKSENTSAHVLPAKNKFIWDQWATPQAAKELNLDLVYNPKLSVPLYCKAPTVMALRPEQFVHPELFRWADRRYFKFFMPRYCKAAKAIIAPAQKAVEDIVRYVGTDPAKTLAVHEGAGDHFHLPAPGEAEMRRVREKYQLPENYVLFVGGITPLKNFERLVEAFGKVRESRDVKLVVVGFNRWSFEKDLAFAASHPAAEHIHFTGFVADEDMPQIYRLARVLFFPSIYEGFGIPAAEAQVTGCPVVTSNRGCTPEVVGDAAVLVDPFSVADMAQGLDKALSDEKLRQEIISKGLKRASHFRFDRVAKQTLEIFQRVARV